MEQQQPHYPPPPYAPSGSNPTQEYGKPPPYFEGAGAGAAPAYPQQPVGFVPPPPHQTRVTETHQGAPTPTVITVTQVPAGYVATQQPRTQTQVLYLGNCPSCRVGFLRSEFDICGILLAIIFFPIGILCCLCMIIISIHLYYEVLSRVRTVSRLFKLRSPCSLDA